MEWLLEHDIYYPECLDSHPIKTQHRFLTDSLAKAPLPIPQELTEWNYIKDKIKAAPQNKILISEEVLWHLFEQRNSEKIKAVEWIKNQFFDYEVKVVCYLRRQDKWVESWYNQIVKTDVNKNSKLSYQEFIDTYRNYGLLNYLEALAPWVAIFGKDNLIVRPFDRQAFVNDDIIADFMSILGVNLDETVVRPEDLQVSLCNSACELTSIYNKTKRASEFKSKFMGIVRDYDSEVDDRRQFTNKCLAESLLSEFKESNILLSNEYGREGEMFFDTNFPGYEYGEYPGLSTQDLASFVMHLFQDMQRQMLVLRKRVSELESITPGGK